MTNITITSDTDVKSVKRRLGVGQDEELRESARRERYLTQTVRLTAQDSDLTLELDEAPPHITNDDDGKQHIVISEQKTEQPITEYTDQTWDLMVQETASLHEAGHALYTHFPRIQNYLEDLEDNESRSHAALARQFWNAIEDCAIEKQLKLEFSSSTERSLNTVNANMIEQNPMGSEAELTDDDDPTVVYDMAQAICVAIINRGMYDDGTIDRILDKPDYKRMMMSDDDVPKIKDFMPTIEQAVEDVMSEPDGEKRAERIIQFCNEALKQVDMSNVGDDQIHRGDTVAPKGDDASEAVGEATAEASQLGDGDEEGEGAGISGDDTDEGDDEAPAPTETDASHEQDYDRSVTNEARAMEGGDALLEEIESMASTMASNDELEHQEILIPEDGGYDTDTKRRASVTADRIGGPLRDAFVQRRRNRMRSGQTFGTLDSDKMIAGSRGDPRIFERRRNEDEPEYTAMVMLDRSGSMGGDKIGNAEVAVGGFVEALNSAGVPTGVIDLHRNELRLGNPFGGKVDQNRGRLFTNASGGGTPLTQAVTVAKHRLQAEAKSASDRPFAVVITDGHANDRNAFRSEINECPFPVVGVYVGNDPSTDDLSAYHRGISVEPGDDMAAKLERLAREMVID